MAQMQQFIISSLLLCVLLSGFYSVRRYVLLSFSSTTDVTTCKTCVLYDVTKSSNADFQCVTLQTANAPICLYEKDDVSESIRKDQVENTAELNIFKSWLESDKSLGVIEVGAGLGLHMLTAASLGRNVLAVEPNIQTVTRLHKSIQQGNFQEQVTVLYNAVSDNTDPVVLLPNSENPTRSRTIIARQSNQEDAINAVVMNDLLPFCRFRKAVLVLEAPCTTHAALGHADLLFRSIGVQYVVVDWAFQKIQLGKEIPDYNFYLIKKMLDFMFKNSYRPYNWDHTELDRQNARNWPNNMYWKKK